MWRTSIACAPAGAFAGPLVVSMRPLRAVHAIRAIQITSRFPAVHGAPVHLGDPRLIGIEDIMKPDGQELAAHSAAIRKRLLEMHQELKVDFPVYALFTKADLIAGFAE